MNVFELLLKMLLEFAVHRIIQFFDQTGIKIIKKTTTFEEPMKVISMKKSTIYLLMLCAGFFYLSFNSCNNNDSVIIPDPDFPQLLGTWEGVTSQGKPIKIGIINFNGVLYVSTYKYSVVNDLTAGGATVNYEVSASTAVAAVIDTSFIFRPYGGYSESDYLYGHFDIPTMTLKGKFTTAFQNQQGTSTIKITGAFTALKTN